MNPFKIVLPASIIVFGLAAGGCAANVDAEPPSDTDLSPASSEFLDEAVRDESGLVVLGQTFTEAPLSPHGGNGGTFTGHVTPAAVIFGVQTISGNEVDSIRFGFYQPRWSDNVWRDGDPFDWTPWFGGGGGGTLNPIFKCPGGKGVIGLQGNAGARVDRIGVICGDVNNPNPTSALNTQSPFWGGGGGTWFGQDKCSAGRLVDSFDIRAGARLDNIRAICISAH